MNRLFVSAILFAMLARADSTQTAQQIPVQLRNVGVTQHLNAQVPRDLTFRDETGATVSLADYTGKRPVLLALVYYECPRLCSMILRGMLKAAAVLPFQAGRDFEMVAVSFDPREKPPLAAATKNAFIERYAKRKDTAGWHFLTGDEAQIKKLTDTVGFRYALDPASNQYSHASTLIVLTPDARVSRYLYGVEYSAKDVRLALVEASQGKIGSTIDQFLLYCFHYDPTTGKYSTAIIQWMRGGAILTIGALAAMVIVATRRKTA
jgi:protein SCO1/2